MKTFKSIKQPFSMLPQIKRDVSDSQGSSILNKISHLAIDSTESL